MKQIIIPKEFANKIEEKIKEYSVIYIYAQIGWGKTSVTLEYLKQKKIPFLYAQAGKNNFQQAISEAKTKVVVVDDLQDILLENEEYLKENFYQLLREHKFIFLSRAYMPAWMKPYQIIGQMGIMDSETLRFSNKEVEKYLGMKGIQMDEPDLYKFCRATIGYPLALTFSAHWIAAGERRIPYIGEKARKDIFDYYDELLFQNWSRELYTFMLQMSGFDQFTLKLATMVTGDPFVGNLIEEAGKVGSFLFKTGDEYTIESFFREYLQYKQKQIFSETAIQNIYHNAGLYYELESDLKNALKYYSLCQDSNKIHELLARNSELHPGIGSYIEVEEYYHALSEEQILQSPVLMSGMCMLCSLKMQVEESEYWYEKLKEFGQQLRKTDLQYKYVIGKLCWLDIALPHRGSANVEKILLDMMWKKQNKEIAIHEFSITSNLPSVVNGGKDFSC